MPTIKTTHKGKPVTIQYRILFRKRDEGGYSSEAYDAQCINCDLDYSVMEGILMDHFAHLNTNDMLAEKLPEVVYYD